MSYMDLANLLDRIAKTVAGNHARLEGKPLGKAADGLAKSATKFEIALTDFLSGSESALRELEQMLKSPQAKKYLPLPGLNIVSREVLGGALTAEKLPAAKKEFLARVKDEQLAEKAAASLKQFLFNAAEVPPPPDDKVALQNELLRLGGLSDDELKLESAHRLKAVGTLRKIAQANSLPVAKSATKGVLIEVITHYARRAHANIVHRT
jgi:hypothetical protein